MILRCHYSPLPIDQYRITSLDRCEVSSIMALPGQQAAAAWNLMWLSLPSVDALPVYGSAPRWYEHYAVTPGASRAIVNDAIGDEFLLHKLQFHPERFLAWFESEQHDIYDCYAALGGDQWVATVTARARISIKHKATLPRDPHRTGNGFDRVLSLFQEEVR